MCRVNPNILLTTLLLFSALQAAEPNVDLSLQNPAIQKVQARMAARAGKVDAWKSAGAIGEESSGTLALRPAEGKSLAEKKEMRDLVVAENEDRNALFRELALANGMA